MDFLPVSPALLIRMLSTALVVIGVSWSVGAFGPLVGGALAGLPMVMGPAFFFLAQSAPPAFVSHAATYTLISLAATQAFVLCYLVLSLKHRPLACLGLALCAWSATAVACRWLPASPWLGAALFACVTAGAIRASRPLVNAAAAIKGKAGWPTLLLRGALAGAMVASITMASGLLATAASVCTTLALVLRAR